MKDGAKSVTIYGEVLLKGYGSPDFVLYKNSIEKWDAPNNQETSTPAEKKHLIQFLEENSSEEKPSRD